jgi:hypothetical protein
VLRISGKDEPSLQAAKEKASYRCPDRLQAPLEAYFALNKRWFMGSRQVQTIVKRVAGHSGVDSKSWIEPFRGAMQKPPDSQSNAT